MGRWNIFIIAETFTNTLIKPRLIQLQVYIFLKSTLGRLFLHLLISE